MGVRKGNRYSTLQVMNKRLHYNAFIACLTRMLRGNVSLADRGLFLRCNSMNICIMGKPSVSSACCIEDGVKCSLPHTNQRGTLNKPHTSPNIGLGKIRQLLEKGPLEIVLDHLLDAKVDTVYAAFTPLEHGGPHSLFKNLDIC